MTIFLAWFEYIINIDCWYLYMLLIKLDPNANLHAFSRFVNECICNLASLWFVDVCNLGNLPEVEILSLIEEQIPKYRLRADTITNFCGYDNQDWIQTPLIPIDEDLELSNDQIQETLKYFGKETQGSGSTVQVDHPTPSSTHTQSAYHWV